MSNIFTQWFQRRFSDPQAVFLAIFLLVGFSVVIYMGQMLAPVIASIIIAYLLEASVARLENKGVPRLAVVIVFVMLLVAFLIFLLFGLLPLLSEQITQLIKELPNILSRWEAALMQMPVEYAYITEGQIDELISTIREEVANLGQRIVSVSLASIPGIITMFVFFILIPVLVFFMLKDKLKILSWFSGYLPRNRSLLMQVWEEMDAQIGNYVRGKIWEILIVGVVTYIGFALLGIKYAMLLSALVGLSVLIPYIGAAVVTIPVVLIAYFQWGWSSEFFYLLIFYGITQALDGYVLVPLLFSEVVNLHPVAIVVAILAFGGLWGFWGVFFAIPLATLVSAVMRAWPRTDSDIESEGQVAE
ncbi:MAG: AI-2E family transporter [Gammaproteobacteria bacterium]|nr:AI-2E family transporter [Gammaproteobacteria bacterium]